MNDVQAAQQELIEEFRFFDNWMDRYQYLIDLGRRLPEFPESEKTEQNCCYGFTVTSARRISWKRLSSSPAHWASSNT
jgi:hypothetical protein